LPQARWRRDKGFILAEIRGRSRQESSQQLCAGGKKLFELRSTRQPTAFVST
jgi:hypothetical protein